MGKNRRYRNDEVPQVKDVLFRSRTILMFEPIDSDSANDIIRQMIAMDQVSNCKKRGTINLMINSPGGDISSMFAIIDAIKRIRCYVDTIIIGQACSAATFIALEGRKRMMTANASWMGHEMHQSLEDYHSKLKCQYEFEKKTWSKCLEMYKDKTKLSKEDFEVIAHGELWLTAEECKSKGIVDLILK